MRVFPMACALTVGFAVTIGSFNMSKDARLESCNSAYHNMIDAPQAASGSFAAQFADTRRAFPGECRPEADNVDMANALLGGLIVTFFAYLFFLLVGKFCRWAER